MRTDAPKRRSVCIGDLGWHHSGSRTRSSNNALVRFKLQSGFRLYRSGQKVVPLDTSTKVELTCEELRKCLPLVPRTLNEAMLSLADYNSRLLQTKLDQAFTSTYALQKLCTKVSQLAASLRSR